MAEPSRSALDQVLAQVNVLLAQPVTLVVITWFLLR